MVNLETCHQDVPLSYLLTLLFLSAFFFLQTPHLFAKVEAPNYDFSLETITPFFPNSPTAPIKAKYPKFEVISEEGELKTLKYLITHVRYKFPIYVVVYREKVIEFFARLPTYFLHDVFHQSMINRFGKQNEYFKHRESAVYIWTEKNNSTFTYSGACSITCFPNYLHALSTQTPETLSNYQSFLQRIRLSP